MNKPAHPIAAPPLTYPDYHTDGYGWAMAQAAIIREGRIDSIDWEHVAEEIESMGDSERRAAESALRVALMHQLKWAHQEMFRSQSWETSIIGHLARFDKEMARNPSLKSSLDDILRDAYDRARYEAAQETGLSLSSFPEDPPSWEEIRAPRTL